MIQRLSAHCPHCDAAARLAEALEPRRLFNSSPAFVDAIDNPYLPFLPGAVYVYRGQDEGGMSIRSRVNVMAETREVMGVTCTVVRDREFVNGELVEDTRDWYAQDRAGNVWYFGEDSREIEDGRVVSRDGSWEAGVNGAFPGIIMRAGPEVGDEYQQEGAPGVAEDRAEVVGFDADIATAFASFGDCLTTRETNPLEAGSAENKFYAPGIGFVMSQGLDDEGEPAGEVLALNSYTLPPAAFTTAIDNPYFPLTPGTTMIYRGKNEEGASLRNRTSVLRDTRVVNGVTCVVVRDRAYEAGELVEDTRDWYAQDLAGNVWYFGEDSRDIEDGQVVGRGGSWEAGINGAVAGIIMRAVPRAGDAYRQELAPGIAEDEARVLGFGAKVRTPFATFGNCLQNEEFTALEPDLLEHKFYAPGIGLVMSKGIRGGNEVMRLSEIRIE